MLHLTVRNSLTVSLCVGALNFVMLPLMGALSDRIGRRPLLITCSVAAFLTGYPAMLWMISDPSFGRLLAVELWLALVYAGYNGAMIVYLTEVMPASVRTDRVFPRLQPVHGDLRGVYPCDLHMADSRDRRPGGARAVALGRRRVRIHGQRAAGAERRAAVACRPPGAVSSSATVYDIARRQIAWR